MEQSLTLKFNDENGNEYTDDIVAYIYKGLENGNITMIKVDKNYKIKK